MVLLCGDAKRSCEVDHWPSSEDGLADVTPTLLGFGTGTLSIPTDPQESIILYTASYPVKQVTPNKLELWNQSIFKYIL